MTSPDVAVVGLGPAGRALAHRLAAAGAAVRAYDPQPHAPWRPTYAGWRDQLPAWLGQDVIGATAGRVDLVARGRHRLAGTYAVLDNDALRAALDLRAVEVHPKVVADVDLPTLAPVVVDCRGSHPRGVPRRGPAQSAFGARLEPVAAERLLGGADAVLMDWRPHDGRDDWGPEAPSFCYVVPLPDGRVLVEETCLAGDPALGIPELRRRLAVRTGLSADALDDAEPERVHIPLRQAPRRGRRPRFGAAGRQLNPISGYSVFAALAQADAAAQALLAGGASSGHQRGADALAGDPSPLRLAALGAVLRLDGDGVVDLFDAFGRLSAADQRAVLDPATPDARLVPALARQGMRMGPAGCARLVGATAGAVPALLRRTR